jgi:hypothetical protein
MLDLLKGWRTIALNLIALLLPLFEEFGVIAYIPKQYMVWYVLAIIAMNLVLRLATTTPVGKKV